jgi:hypothetical protein
VWACVTMAFRRPFALCSSVIRPFYYNSIARKRRSWALVALFCLQASSRPDSFAFLRPFQTSSRHLFSSAPHNNMSILDSPSAERNKEPIWTVLSERVVPLLLSSDDKPLAILEVAAGAGVHTAHFASQQWWGGASVTWIPSDPDQASRASIAERSRVNNLQQIVQPPVELTLGRDGIEQSVTDSAIPPLDLVICINMIHISPWEATIGLMKMASAKLKAGGILFCYGPYKVGGTAVESNL